MAMAEARSLSCTRQVGGVRTHYLEKGTGETLILVHGGGVFSSGELIYGSVMPLLGQHLHTIAVDLVGFGRTPWRGPQDTRPQAQAEFLVQFMEELDLKAHIAGISNGGWTIQYVAHRVPHRVKSLIMINSLNGISGLLPPGHFVIWDPDRQCYGPPETKIVHHLPEGFTRDDVRAALWERYINKHLITEQHVSAAYEIARLNNHIAVQRQGARGSDWLHYQGRHIAEGVDRIEVPVLLTWSRENVGSSPSDAFVFFNRLARAEFHVFTGAAHILPFELPQRWAQVVVDFVSAAKG